MTTETLSHLASGGFAPHHDAADAVVVLATRTDDGFELSDRAAFGNPQLSEGLAALAWAGDPGTTARVPIAVGERRVVVTVVAVPQDADAAQIVEAAATGVRANQGVAHTAVDVDADPERLYLAAVLATHAFTGFRSEPSPRTARVTVIAEPRDTTRLDSLIDAIRFTRDLVTLPAADTVPAALAERLRSAAEEAGAACTVYSGEQLEQLGMRGLLAVGQGSVHAPALVRLHAPGTGEGSVAVVGKGLTYDSGGMNLKLAMLDQMKLDMAGGAAAAAAVLHAARHPGSASITAWVPLAENVQSGSGYHTGDVLRMRSGLTVEVQNTDAEGRLVLADAMDLALEEQPDRLVTIATLTGNQMLALGLRTAGLMARDAVLREELVAAAADSAESVWPMPRLPYLAAKLKSQVADIANLGENFGQMMIAAAFLERFAGQTPYAHLDIAGPSYNHGEPYGAVAHGGTGFGVATLVALLDRVEPGD